jgi:ribosomal protein S13
MGIGNEAKRKICERLTDKDWKLIETLKDKNKLEINNILNQMRDNLTTNLVWFFLGILLFILVMVLLWFAAVRSEDFKSTYQGIFCSKLM